ncbi:unnamed protein product [Urochloa decumbens]|uniref:Uncharacterized protein n=1 Tax=Urochloa decumbens TaxID=240449 RepID=A0ABC8W9G5_9POAL
MTMMQENGLFAEVSEFLTPTVAVSDVQPAMGEEGESRAMACGGRPCRRSPRLKRKEELSACSTEQDLILKLKREERALRHLQRLSREARLAESMQAASQSPVIAGMKRSRTVTQTAGKTKRKKVIKTRVPLERIEYMILSRHRRNPHQGICDDLEVGKRSRRFRENYAQRMAIANKYFEYQDALIKQFRDKGYADDYAEVTDNEEGN